MLKNPSTLPEGAGHFLIDGPSGALELKTALPEQTPHHIGVICHPNPLQEGTMDNKVVHTVAKAFERLGALSVRFNYRGVGASEGEFGQTAGELDDLSVVVRWVRQHYPHTPLWLAGFSFGAYIAARGAMLHAPQRLLTIAPAVHLMDYSTLEQVCPWMTVVAMADEVVPVPDIQAWLATMPDIETLEVPDCSHFFHRKLVPLREAVEHYFAG